jgi:hypothetical protein
MENSPAARQLLWDKQQRASRAEADIEQREWLKNFALVFALLVLTLTIATVLAGLSADTTIRL